MMHLSYAQFPRRRVKQMDLNDIFRFVAPSVRNAALSTAAELQRLGVRYALAGGLAVGAHGYIRATSDVDFLVGDEAFIHHGAFVTFKPGIPIAVEGVRIDYLSPVAFGAPLEDALDHPTVCEGVAVLPMEALIYMKLMAKRRRDLLDVVELVKAGANTLRVREYLKQHAADLLPLFDELASEAVNDL